METIKISSLLDHCVLRSGFEPDGKGGMVGYGIKDTFDKNGVLVSTKKEYTGIRLSWNTPKKISLSGKIKKFFGIGES